MNQDLKKKVDELIPNLAKVRRDLHKHPESGWTEFRTWATPSPWVKRLCAVKP